MTICIIVASIMAFLSFFFLLSPSYYNYTNYYDNPLIINHVMESNSKIEFKMVFVPAGTGMKCYKNITTVPADQPRQEEIEVPVLEDVEED